MSKNYWIWIIGLAIVGSLAGAVVGRLVTRPAVPNLESGTWLPQPRSLEDFNLIDTHEVATTSRDLRGHPTLVFFGFTHCPDVCPTTLALLANVQKQVAIPGLKVALISVDPERDTPPQMARYIASFGGDLIGLTGTPPEIVSATRSFGVAFARVELPGGSYTMDHSATVFLLDSRARIVAVFTPPLTGAALARDITQAAPWLDAAS